MRASFAYLEEELPRLHSGELEWLVRAGNTAPQGQYGEGGGEGLGSCPPKGYGGVP